MKLEFVESDEETKAKIRKQEFDDLADRIDGFKMLLILLGVSAGPVLVGICFAIEQYSVAVVFILIAVIIVVLGILVLKKMHIEGKQKIAGMKIETATVKMIGREHIQTESKDEYSLEVMDTNSVMESTVRITVSSAEYEAFKAGKTAYLVRYGEKHKLKMFIG